MTTTDSIPIIRRSGYNPIPELPFTGPTSFIDRVSQSELTGYAPAPPVLAIAHSRREEYREPIAADPHVTESEIGLVAPREKCKCTHEHGSHENLRRSDRCTRCRCQGFDPAEHVVPATAEEEERGTRWRTFAGYAVVAMTGAFCGAGLLAVRLMTIGVIP